MTGDLKHGDVTGDVLKSAFEVHKILGGGFLEKVYENALKLELDALGHKVESQYPLIVKYNEAIIGEFYGDLVVDRKVVVELKVASEIHSEHQAQLRNYLKASGLEVGLIICFGFDRVRYKRMIFGKS